MKRTLVASILGIVASVATTVSSYGQGQVWFDNYNNANVNGPASGASSPISAAGGPINGTRIPSSFTVDLYYVLGTATDPGAGNPFAPGIGTLIMSRPIGASTPGYVSPAIATIPNYVSGSITFELVAHGTASGQAYQGHS